MANPSNIHFTRIPDPSCEIDNLFCYSCKLLLTGLLFSCQKCNKKFCNECNSSKILGNSKCCFACKSSSDQIVEEMQEMALFETLIIKCQFNNSGCPEILNYDKLIIHEVKCMYRPYICSKCGQANLIVSNIEQHKKECPFSKIHCPECNELVIKNDLTNHLKRKCIINLFSCLRCQNMIDSEKYKEHRLNCLYRKNCIICEVPLAENHKCDFNKGLRKITKLGSLSSYHNRTMRKEHEVLQFISEDIMLLIKQSELELKEFVKDELSNIKLFDSRQSISLNSVESANRLQNLEASLALVARENAQIGNSFTEIKNLILSQNQSSNLDINPLKTTLKQSFKKRMNNLFNQVSDSLSHNQNINKNELVKLIQDNLSQINSSNFNKINSTLEEIKTEFIKMNSTLVKKGEIENLSKKIDYTNDEVLNSIKKAEGSSISLIKQEMESSFSNLNSNLKEYKDRIVNEVNVNKSLIQQVKSEDIEQLRNKMDALLSSMNQSKEYESKLENQFKLFEKTIEKENSKFNLYLNNDFKKDLAFIVQEEIARSFNEKVLPKFKAIFDISNKLKRVIYPSFNTVIPSLSILFTDDFQLKENFLTTEYGSKLEVGRIKRDQQLSNNSYLYYFDYEGNLLHIKNVNTCETFIQELYYNSYYTDAAFHQNSIFVCGGKDKSGNVINNCGIFNLLNKNKSLTSKLTQNKCAVSLCSNLKFIFCIGGFVDYGQEYIKTSEYFDPEKLNWVRLNALNNGDCGICLHFDSKQFIYTLGGYLSQNSLSKIERLNSESLSNSWKLIDLSCARRTSGSCFNINQNEILLFGGDYCSDYYFYIFNHITFTIHKLEKQFERRILTGSKPLFFNNLIWIISAYSKIIYKLNPCNLEIKLSQIDF